MSPVPPLPKAPGPKAPGPKAPPPVGGTRPLAGGPPAGAPPPAAGAPPPAAPPAAAPPARPLSALDRAHALRLAGLTEESLRLVASIAAATPEDAGAAWLLARLLFDGKRPAPAAKLAAAVVERALRRGDLPLAVVGAQLAREAGSPTGEDALRSIAATFGKGSPRLGKPTAFPPTLPAVAEAAPHFAALSGAALLDAAEQAAQRCASSKDAVPADAKVPVLPLFGALEPPSLLELLGKLSLLEQPTGAAIIKQGEPGRDAFVVVRGVVDVERHDDNGEHTRLASLGPGALFGEMALVSDTPRAASALAAEPVQLLCVARADLELLAQSDPALGRELGRFCHGRMIANLMRHSAIFAGVPANERAQLMEHFETRRFARGEKLVTQGEQASCLYLLASGQVQVRSTDAQGERTVLAQLGPGDVVGEISLVLRRPASAEVVALSATVALALDQQQLREATREHPELLRELYDIAVQREEETRSVVAQPALDVSDTVLL
ncbi:MAG TPA: cyclic nucleotide-binding domain-containing protein [Polyangiales bacterium]|nr:cyclic nucleotide-binding domain-containing protein [Polyangiales bacterium]